VGLVSVQLQAVADDASNALRGASYAELEHDPVTFAVYPVDVPGSRTYIEGAGRP
jgi:hypothetical protein